MKIVKSCALPLLVAVLLTLVWSNRLTAQTSSRESIYITMPDSVKVAVDVFLPQITAGQQIPAVIRSTRYWRAFDIINPQFIDDDTALEGEFWNTFGYAFVVVDARGSGASFGSRTSPWSGDEINDLGEVSDWIAAQNWSNSKIGSFGVSYDGNTAEFTGSVGRSEVKVIAPHFSDFDPYLDLAIPGGVKNVTFVQAWSEFNELLDANDICGVVGADPGDCPSIKEFIVSGVRPVDADPDRTMLDEAILQHANNLVVGDAIQSVVYKDDLFGSVEMKDFSPYAFRQDIEQSGVAYFAQAGWFDAGTANGVLTRFHTFSNPQFTVIGPWGHGSEDALDPFHPGGIDSVSVEEQYVQLEAFMAPYLKETTPPQAQNQILYYTLNEGAWKTTDVWPPADVVNETLFFSADGKLAENPSQSSDAFDSYTVDFTATTGVGGRWLQDNDKLITDRQFEDQKLLTYTSEPLTENLEITGHPQVKLFVRSSESDGTFIAYLEDVAPDGRVTYITEGILRALHRQVSNGTPPYHQFGPYHSYLAADGAPIPANEIVELHFTLQPTSVMLEPGHRIRVAIAGHDADTFERIPTSGTPVLDMQRSAAFPSQIILPIVTGTPLGFGDENTALPENFSLKQNYPNPFNPSTTISFGMAIPGQVTVKVFDLQGRQVATVVDGNLTSGEHQFTFNAAELASGTYFYQLQAGNFTTSRKMVLMK
ncbi:MAG: CocE/NonD family hydrolase [Calditrichia bacterium]